MNFQKFVDKLADTEPKLGVFAVKPPKNKMNKKQANDLVKDLYGPTAGVVNVSAKNRHERFGVSFVETAGALSAPKLHVLGHGDSYDSAIEHARSNPVAIFFAEQWTKTKEDYKQFKDDPVKYMNDKKEEIERTIKNG